MASVDFILQSVSALKIWVWTLFLFTYTDYKTIMFPVTIFASVSAPVSSLCNFVRGIVWIWVHLLQCNTSNQYKTGDEDAVNHPWRPIPSGRVSPSTAKALRWILVPICMGISTPHGWNVAAVSSMLTVATVVYDEVGLSGHWIGKSLSAAFGYGLLETGATAVMGTSSDLDVTAARAVVCSMAIILTTVHAQDCSDVEGDAVLGRVTFPIYSPEWSRRILFVATIGWSIVLILVWGANFSHGALLFMLGGYVGWRYQYLRSVQDDKRSYVLYNIWLLLVHSLPAQHRWAQLSMAPQA